VQEEAAKARQEAEERERLRKQEEEEARLLLIEQEEQRLKALAQQLEDEGKRLKEEQEAAKRREEEERLRREAEENERKEQDRLRREETEREAEKQRQESERIKLEMQEIERIQEEQRLRELEQQEAARKLEEEAMRLKAAEAEAIARREQEQQEAARKLEEEAMRLKAAEAEAIARREQEQQEMFRKAEEKVAQEQEERRLAEMEQELVVQPDQELHSPAPSPLIDEDSADPNEDGLFDTIDSLRNRLRSMSLEDRANPSPHSSHATLLPSAPQVAHFQSVYAEICESADGLPRDYKNTNAKTAFESLNSEIQESKSPLDRCQELAWLSTKISDSDAALSDLLEHVDGYPVAPVSDLQSNHISDPKNPPEEQLSARVAFTNDLLSSLDVMIDSLPRDSRVTSERERLEQTWSELQEMATDRITNKSRPSTASGHGRSSSRTSSLSASSASSAASNPSSAALKKPMPKTPSQKKSRGNIGLGPSPRPSLLSPLNTPKPPSSRAISVALSSRKDREPKLIKKRSVSGPLVSPNSSVHRSTYSSRQRTSSTTSNAEPETPTKPSFKPPLSPYKTPKPLRAISPNPSEASSNHSKQRSASQSLKSKLSFSQTPRPVIPKPPVRKPYVANPKNKLDVAVGNIVNKMEVAVPIQAVASSSWEDKSGKYWIGDDEDAKLCFCRILRSQTVMVRVGGGWCELSKFLRDHFAHLVEQIPEAPSMGTKDIKWISSSTLGGNKDGEQSSNPFEIGPPRTPEPKGPLPAVLLHTPSGTSPRSVHSSGSPGSPLAPLQFIRKAEESPIRSSTPTHRLAKSTTARTPSRV
ncbi:4527_t:CDS:2, partial [Acaulospora colombiana]